MFIDECSTRIRKKEQAKFGQWFCVRNDTMFSVTSKTVWFRKSLPHLMSINFIIWFGGSLTFLRTNKKTSIWHNYGPLDYSYEIHEKRQKIRRNGYISGDFFIFCNPNQYSVANVINSIIVCIKYHITMEFLYLQWSFCTKKKNPTGLVCFEKLLMNFNSKIEWVDLNAN